MTKMKVNIIWSKPKKFSRELSYAELYGVFGVYIIITNRNEYYEYDEGDSRIVYIGSGEIGKRLTDHSSDSPNNEWIANALDGGKLLFIYCIFPPKPKDFEKCCEHILVKYFREKYGFHKNGNSPFANTSLPSLPFDIEYDEEILEIVDKYDVLD